MTNQVLHIPGELPTLNAALAGAKRHWSSYSTVKKQQTNKICWLARRDLRPVAHPVELEFWWTTRTRRQDPDNITHGAKYIIDGLVAAEILPNDSRRTVKKITHWFPDVDPENPRIDLELKEIDGEELAQK